MSQTWVGGELDPAATLAISTVAQGDGESNRTGRTYTIHSVHVRGFVVRDREEAVSNPTADIICRVVLVYDKQTNGAQLNAEDVMLAATEDVTSWRNLQFSQRFKVLWDKTMVIPASRGSTTNGSNSFSSPKTTVKFIINKEFTVPIKVRCSGTGGTISDVTDNSLHLIGVSRDVNTTFTCESRIRFTG